MAMSPSKKDMRRLVPMPDPASEGVDVAGGVDFTAVAVVAAFAAVAVVAVGVTVDILYQRQGYKQHMSGTTYVVIGTTYVVIGTTYVVIGTTYVVIGTT